MRFSRSLIGTIKDFKKEGEESATLKSQEYLLRGGFVTQIASGIYDFLPLGKKMLDNIAAIIREELDAAGCVEVELALVCPGELWKKSARYEKYGKELLRFKDRKDNEFVISPTCEELMVELAKSKITSYRQLPLNLYQINLKFRDEVRPRYGLLRGREFWMKDGYSFHENTDDMIREFSLMEETYKRIFTRLGVDFKIVEADSGAIGGSGSKEFMVIADAGEDTLAVCEACDYGANVEAATRQPKLRADGPFDTQQEIATPNQKSIAELSTFLDISPECFVKCIVKKAHYKDGDKLVAFYVNGDDDLEETKACNACNALELFDASEDDLQNAGLVPGFIGIDVGIDSYFDTELKNRKGLVSGANKIDTHMQGVSIPDSVAFKDLILVKEGDICPRCGKRLKYAKGIEVGHIFQLGERYSAPMEAKFLDRNGKTKNFVMGTYGIGVSRLISAIIEQCSDEKGCILPLSVAPYGVDIIISNIKDDLQIQTAQELYAALQANGISVILDDRDERYGHKMADFELIGFPYALIIGKNIQNGIVEIVDRKNLEKIPYNADNALNELLSKMRSKGTL